MRSVSSDVSGDPVYSSLLSSSPASSAVSVTVLHCIAFIVTHVVTLTLRCYIDIALLHQVVTLHFPPSHVGEQLRVRGDGSHQSVVPLTVHMLPVTITTPPPYFHISTLSPNIFKYSTIQGKISIRLQQQLWRRCGAEFMECPPLHLRLDTVPFLPSLVLMIAAVQSWDPIELSRSIYRV